MSKQLASFNLEQEATALQFPLKTTEEHNEGVTASLADAKEISMGSVVAEVLSGIFTLKEEKQQHCFISDWL